MKSDETEENVGTWGLGSVLPTQAGPDVSVGMGKTGAHDPYAKVWSGGMSLRVCTHCTLSPCPRECNIK